jgi:hypothetical protein
VSPGAAAPGTGAPMKVFFVVGAARSGTTLLTRLLSAHPRIHLHHERRVLELAGVAGALLRTGGRAVEPNPPPQTLAADLARGRRYAESVLRAGAPEGTAWFGDKYPPYAGQVPTLAAVWPEARFIHIVRDGRGVVASWLHTWPRDHAWRRSARVPAVETIAASWAHSVDTADAAGAQLGPGRFHAFRYDDLLDDPMATGRRWLQLLGEDSHPDFEAALAQVSRRGDWRRDLSKAETAAVEAEPKAAATLARWGWEQEAPSDVPPDTVADWVARAEAEPDPGAARRAWLRVLRLDPGHPGAVAWLMRTQAGRGESLFALMNLRPGRSEAHAARTRALLEARGLDAEAAAALVGERS